MAGDSWLEVSMLVDGELAEAVAEVLSRYLPNGVVIESTEVAANRDDSGGHPVGPLRVYGYLPVDDQLEETRRRVEEGLWYLGRIRPLPVPEFRFIQETDWSETWKQHYQPVTVGRCLVIVPAWLDSPAPERIPIRIDPGMAFGTGTHPTTQLSLELLEDVLTPGEPGAPERAGVYQPAENETVIDVGCGSGILSVAAIKLGVEQALGVDIDAQSINACAENAALNGVTGKLEAGLGSVKEILAGQYAIRQSSLVLANILAPIIIRLFDEGLAELVTPGGILLLSGILEEQAAEVEAAALRFGMQVFLRRQIGDWVALGLRFEE